MLIVIKLSETSLHVLIGYIEGALKVKENLMVIFLDIEGAFSYINSRAIIIELSNLGVNENIVGIVDYLHTKT